MLHDSPFLFAACQAGAEKALKKEVLSLHPHFRFAFSRPGFVTFKNTEGAIPLDFELKSVFARVYGVAAPQNVALKEWHQSLQDAFPGRPMRVHLWERDQHLPGSEPLGFKMGAWLKNPVLESQLFGPVVTAETFSEVDVPALGDLILHVIAVDADRFVLGAHAHTLNHSLWPGGRPLIAFPEAAPSRAYLKLEEALLWSRAPLSAGDTALELGSAPGGASYALLQRGLKVIGVDPAVMHPIVARHANFTHLQVPVAQIHRGDLPANIEWLLVDMNIDPGKSLSAVDRLSTRMKDTLLGGILTFKLNQWSWADEIPGLLKQLKLIGFQKVRAGQLSFNRQEFVVYCLTRRGVARSKGYRFKIGSRVI